LVEFNPFAYAFHEDPYPIYTALRREAPIYRNDDLGFWAFSRHADVLRGFKDWETYSNLEGVALEQRTDASRDVTAFMSILGMDPPRHGKIRAIVSRGFTPRRVAELEPQIRAMAVHYLDRLVETGPCDFIAEFAGRLRCAAGQTPCCIAKRAFRSSPKPPSRPRRSCSPTTSIS
jgi:cytochrome P450